MSDSEHQEKHFESYVVSKLKAQGWKVGDTTKYDTEYALYPEDLIAWLEATQPEKWEKLQKDNKERALEAVSYTHLDVYKRQRFRRFTSRLHLEER